MSAVASTKCTVWPAPRSAATIVSIVRGLSNSDSASAGAPDVSPAAPRLTL